MRKVLGLSLALLLLAGCHEDMWIQPKVKAQEPSDFFPDGQSMRPLVAHTVDRTHFWTDEGRYTGYIGKKLVDTFPFKITLADLQRGQERFNIYCSPCHGALGDGQGMIAVRGLALRRQPATYHTDRLRKMPIGHFYDVITNGYGVMYSYASRVEPDDRWRIAAYIRVLQRSRHANPSDVPPDHQNILTGTVTPPPPVTNTAVPPAGTEFPPPASTPNGAAPGGAAQPANPSGNGTINNGQ